MPLDGIDACFGEVGVLMVVVELLGAYYLCTPSRDAHLIQMSGQEERMHGVQGATRELICGQDTQILVKGCVNIKGCLRTYGENRYREHRIPTTRRFCHPPTLDPAGTTQRTSGRECGYAVDCSAHARCAYLLHELTHQRVQLTTDLLKTSLRPVLVRKIVELLGDVVQHRRICVMMMVDGDQMARVCAVDDLIDGWCLSLGRQRKCS